MTKILLVWEEVPETIKTFSFDADKTMMKWLPLCHRNFINAECNEKEQAALMKLNDFLQTIKPIDDASPFRSGDCLVILSGFLL